MLNFLKRACNSRDLVSESADQSILLSVKNPVAIGGSPLSQDCLIKIESCRPNIHGDEADTCSSQY